MWLNIKVSYLKQYKSRIQSFNSAFSDVSSMEKRQKKGT